MTLSDYVGAWQTVVAAIALPMLALVVVSLADAMVAVARRAMFGAGE